MSAIARSTRNNSATPCERIIEVVVPAAQDARPQLTLVLPLLAHLSNNNDGRWLTCIVHVADHICAREGFGYSLTCKGDPLDPAVLAEINFPIENVNELVKSLPEALKETEALLT